MWTKPEDAERQKKISAEFWKPVTKGEVLTGRLKEISGSFFGRYLYITPAVIYPKEGEPQGYGSMGVGVNSWLEKLVTDEHVGVCLAIAFQGLQSTPQGKMRKFSVYEIPDSTWELQTNRDLGAEFLLTIASDTPPPIIEEEDEEIPF